MSLLDSASELVPLTWSQSGRAHTASAEYKAEGRSRLAALAATLSLVGLSAFASQPLPAPTSGWVNPTTELAYHPGWRNIEAYLRTEKMASSLPEFCRGIRPLMAAAADETPCSESGSYIVDESRTRVRCRTEPGRISCRVTYAHIARGGVNAGWLHPDAGNNPMRPAELASAPLARPARPLTTEVLEARADTGWRILPTYVPPHVGVNELKRQLVREIRRLQGVPGAEGAGGSYQAALDFLARNGEQR